MICGRRTYLAVTVLAAAVVLLAPGTAQASGNSAKSRHPAYVDGSALVELAEKGGPAGEMVEVTLKRPMLKALGKAYGRHNTLFGDFLRGLDSIQAVVASSPVYLGITGNFDTVEQAVAKIVSQLEEQGWERMARVKEGSQTVMVYSHVDQDELDGLTVFVLKSDEGEFIFTNIAGRIDLALLPMMGADMDIPGLQLGHEAIEREKQADEDSGDETTERSAPSDSDEGGADGSSA
jgi:hypothetical protein